MNLQRHAITLAAALLVSAVTPDVEAQVRVAVVDLQQALNETDDGRQAKRRLKTLFRRRQKALDAAQNKLKQMAEDIEKQKSVLSREALQSRMEEYQKALIELQSQYMEYQQELATKEAQLTKRILDRMRDILQRIGRADNYTIIVEANEGGVIWVQPSLDLTSRLVTEYNSGGGAGSDLALWTAGWNPGLAARPARRAARCAAAA